MTQETSIPYPEQAAVWPPAIPDPPFVEPISRNRAASIVGASIGAGVLGQLLFVHQAGGINVPIWVVVVLVAAFALRPADARLDRSDAWLPMGAVAFAIFITLRDDASLFLFDFLAAGSLTLAAVVAIGGQPVSRRAWAALSHLAFGAVVVAIGGAARIAAAAAPLLRHVPLGRHTTTARIGRGLLIAVPLVLFFALLFGSADAVFANLVSQIFRVDLALPDLIGRVVVAAVLAWFFAGTMAATRLSTQRFGTVPVTASAVPTPKLRTLGTVETLVVLVALDLVFAAFVLVQAAYLFPGTDPLAVSGMTYSAYARRGFFELVAAAVMVGLVILWLDAVTETRTRAYRVAAGVLVAFTGVVLVSAAVRLDFYQQAYGWTELRFYVLAAIGLLAIGVVAAAVGLLLGRVSTLPKVMLGAGLAVAIMCNVVGPQAFVTEQNLQRVINPALVPEGGYSGLDTWYLGLLGADSIAVITAHLSEIQGEDGVHLRSALTLRATELRDRSAELGWPSWNYGRQRALDALAAARY